MEDELNKRRKTGNLRVVFWFVPLPRDQLLPALVDGKVDMVMAQLTVTPERQQRVDFTNPTRKDVNEVVVTGPGAPAITSVDDLSGQQVFVRKTSSYYQSLLALNERLTADGCRQAAGVHRGGARESRG
jgi:ABC-type amino acid transport substrate-binding protein